MITPCDARLAPVSVRRLCEHHPKVNYKHEWGCPECLSDLRSALQLIRRSSLADCDSGVLWGQWCRDVACAALDGDSEMLKNLALALPKPPECGSDLGRGCMEQLLRQIEDAEAMHGPAYDAALNRLSGGKLEAGNRCSWCFGDDLEFWGNSIPHPKDWFYHGLIIPLPGHDGRGKLEPDNCIVCVLDYPIEKENPEVDWVALLHLLETPGLHRLHVMETIRMMGRKPANAEVRQRGTKI
jgi:hypothetical protein